MRFQVDSEIEAGGVQLAVENLDKVEIRWNGEAVSNRAVGWYVDRDIQTVPLPPVKMGKNALELTIPFEKKETAEWCYLLGDFGVQVQGREKKLTRRAETLRFGSIVPQTLPFYSGTVTYHIPFYAPDTGMLCGRFPGFHAALLKCSVDDGAARAVAFAPYELKEQVAAGAHTLHVTAYINRTNGFGPVHNADRNVKWFGSDAWKTMGDLWTYEYVLQEEGVMSVPSLTLRMENAVQMRKEFEWQIAT